MNDCEYCNGIRQVIAAVTNKDMMDNQDIKSETAICSKIDDDGERKFYIDSVMYYFTPTGYVGTGDDKQVPIKYCPFCGRKLED